MKKVVIGILVLLIVAYTGWWYNESQRFKNTIMTHLQEWKQGKEEQRTFDYEEATTGGYPFAFNVQLKNPQWSWESTESPVPFRMNVQHVGDLILSQSVDQVSYQLSGTGNTIITGHSNDVNQELNMSVNGPFKASWVMDREGNRRLLGEKIPVKQFNFKGDNITWTFQDPEDQFSLSFANLEGLFDWKQNTDSTDAIVFKLNSENFKFNHELSDTAAAPTTAEEATNRTKYEMQQLIGRIFKPHLSPQAKNSFNLKGDLQLLHHQKRPEWLVEAVGSETRLLDLIPTFICDIQQLTWSNQFENHEEKVKFGGFFEGDTYHLVLQNEGYTQMTEKYPEVIAEAFSQERLSNINAITETGQTIKGIFLNHSDLIKTLIPRLHEIGKIHHQFDIDLMFNSSDKTPNKVDVHAFINNFDFWTNKYGVKGSSKLNFFWDAQDFPWETANFRDQSTWLTFMSRFQALTGTVTLKWVDYQRMVDDFIPYVNRWIDVTNKIGGMPTKIPYLNDETAEPFLNFLTSVSDYPEQQRSKDLEITFSYLPAGQLLIGTLSAEQVASNFQKMSEETQAIWLRQLTEQNPQLFEEKTTPSDEGEKNE